MTPFEQFIAQEYGRKQGDPIDDIYDEARARWRQQRTMPMDTNARAAQGFFDSLPAEPTIQAGAVDLSRNQRADLSAPVQTSADKFDLSTLMTPTNRSVFDDLPDAEQARQAQLTEMEIAQRRNSGAADAQQPQSQGLPDELVQQTWRMFADEYTEHKARLDGPIKSDLKNALITDFTQGFAENYAPVLGVTRTEAETLVDKARSEKRPILMSDWKGTQTSPASRDPKADTDAIAVARGLREMGREKEAQAYLRDRGLAQNENTFDTAMTLAAENEQLLQAKKIGRFTTQDASGNVVSLTGDEIDNKLAQNQNLLAGMAPALAMTKSEPDKFVNIEDFISPYVKNNSILPSSVTKINEDLAAMAEKNPNLMVIDSSGMISPASKFKYEILSDEEQAPPEVKTTEQIDNISEGIGRAVRRTVPIVAPIAQTYLDVYRRALETLPPVRAKKELEMLQNAAPYVRGAISGAKRGFKGE